MIQLWIIYRSLIMLFIGYVTHASSTLLACPIFCCETIASICMTTYQYLWYLNLECLYLQWIFPGTTESMILSSICVCCNNAFDLVSVSPWGLFNKDIFSNIYIISHLNLLQISVKYGIPTESSNTHLLIVAYSIWILEWIWRLSVP